jgi:alpha-tubulin suppressor-like RCC1 family protein
MPDIKIVKFKARRGSESQRTQVVFDEGEILYTTDGKRLFVGDGATSGGTAQTVRIHPPNTLFENTNAFPGDLVLRNNLFYQLTGTNPSLSANWVYVGAKPDNVSIKFTENNTLTTVASGITVQPNGALNVNEDGVGVNVDGDTIEIAIAGEYSYLQLKDLGITTDKLSNDMFNSVLSPIVKDTTNDILNLKYNTSNFELVNGYLSLKAGADANIAQLMEGSLATGSLYLDSTGTVFVYGTDSLSKGAFGNAMPGGAVRFKPQQAIFDPPFTVSNSIAKIVGSYATAFVITKGGYVYTTGNPPSGSTQTNYSTHFKLLNTNTGLPLTGITNIVASPVSNLTYLSASYFAIDSNNSKIYSWGYNEQYQLGHGHTTYVSNPTLVTDLTAKDIYNIVCMCGVSSSYLDPVSGTTYALANTGVYAVGSNQFGQLGIGQSINNKYANTFTLIPGTLITTESAQVANVYCSSDCTYILSNDGTVSACGMNPWGIAYSSTTTQNTYLTALSTVPGLSNVSKLAVNKVALSGTRFAITTSKDLYGWGSNVCGQLGTNATTHVEQPTYIKSNINDIFIGGNDHTQTTSFYVNSVGDIYGTGYSATIGAGGFGYGLNRVTFGKVLIPNILISSGAVQTIRFTNTNTQIGEDIPLYTAEILLNTGKVLNAGYLPSVNAYAYAFQIVTF